MTSGRNAATPTPVSVRTQTSVAHLENRAQRACDSLGNRGRSAPWSLQDVTAVRMLIREIARLQSAHETAGAA